MTALQELLGGVEEEIRRAEQRLRKDKDIPRHVTSPSKTTKAIFQTKAVDTSRLLDEAAIWEAGGLEGTNRIPPGYPLDPNVRGNGTVQATVGSPGDNGSCLSIRRTWDGEGATSARGLTGRDSLHLKEDIILNGSQRVQGRNEDGGNDDDCRTAMLNIHNKRDALISHLLRERYQQSQYDTSGVRTSDSLESDLEEEKECASSLGTDDGELFFASDLLGNLGSSSPNNNGNDNGMPDQLKTRGSPHGRSSAQIHLHDIVGGIWGGVGRGDWCEGNGGMVDTVAPPKEAWGIDELQKSDGGERTCKQNDLIVQDDGSSETYNNPPVGDRGIEQMRVFPASETPAAATAPAVLGGS
ncbi:unnamed protein product, partial [Choristocarpus tenellus]